MSKKEEMFTLIEKWQQSGLSRTQFTKQHKIGTHAFDYWRRIYSNQKITPSKPIEFIEIVTTPKLQPSEIRKPQIEMELPNGLRITIY